MPRFQRQRAALLAGAAYAIALIAVQSCSDESGGGGSAAPPATEPVAFVPPVRNPAEGIAYVGAASCRECHTQEYSDWTESDHHAAMAVATEETVLADFDDVTFSHFGREWRFFREGEKFMVNAEDADGVRQDFEVTHTFGHEPLQQYLIPFPGGRYQALQVCWDTRPKEDGGQRWYHLYQDEEIPPDDPLHWTRPLFNWNYMCADCHSTDLKKNYDLESDSYQTTFAEINVSCEACHGPGEKHVAWAKAEPRSESGEVGLVVRLKEPGEPAAWVPNPETGQPERTRPLESTVQVETCARCHSHRRPIQPDYFPGQSSFLDTHVPSTLDDVLYHHDGQIEEEVYVYGSFTQSKMFHHGVRCTDCHHPHTAKTYLPDNNLCTQCHVAANYDTPDHHHHPAGSTGTSCVGCHMPGKYYMVVDWRLDHSIRIPRPDLSGKTGAPNACTECHGDKDDAWAAKTSLDWWGEKLTAHPEFGTAFASRSPSEIREVIATPSFPAIVRASAIARLAEPAPAGLDDPDPLVRTRAVQSYEVAPPGDRIAPLSPLLHDPVRSFRIAAARMLAPASRSLADPEVKKALASAIDEFKAAQAAIADRPGAHMALALLYGDLGLPELAESSYRTAVRIAPEHVPSRVNLAEYLQQSNRAAEALPLLREAVAAEPTSSIARESLGRYYIRIKEYDQGIAQLQLAADLDPGRAPIQYFYGIALNSTGRTDEAFPYLQRAHTLEPESAEYLVGLTTVSRDAGRFAEALSWAEKLLALDPTNPQAQQLRAQMEAAVSSRR